MATLPRSPTALFPALLACAILSACLFDSDDSDRDAPSGPIFPGDTTTNRPTPPPLVQVGYEGIELRIEPATARRYAFRADSGREYVIEALGDLDTRLQLNDIDDTTKLAADDDGGNGENPSILWSCPRSGTYHVILSNNRTDLSVDVRLRIRSSYRGVVLDSLEKDDDPTQAKRQALGTTVPHTLHAGDADWVLFSATRGTTYFIRLEGEVDVELAVRGVDTVVNFNWNTVDEQLTALWTCPRTGDYRLRIATRYSSSTGNYSVFLDADAPALSGKDSYEPDDDKAHAKEIPTDSTIQNRTLHPEDRDVLRFHVDSGESYVVQQHGNLETAMSVTDTTGRVIGQDQTGTFGGNPVVGFVATRTGTYFASIGLYHENLPGPYGITIHRPLGSRKDNDAYEPDNQRSQAKPILAGAPMQKRALSNQDVDWIRFQGQAGKTYRASILSRQHQVMVFTTDSVRLAYQSKSSSIDSTRVDWFCPVDGEYLLQVTSSVVDTYSIVLDTIARKPPNDAFEPDDRRSLAKAIPPDSTSQLRYFASESDSDWMAFQGVAGTIYRIRTSGSSNPDLALFDSDSTWIDSDKNDGDGQNAWIEFRCPRDGRYLILAVAGSMPWQQMASYGIAVWPVEASRSSWDPYESDDAKSQAKPIATDSTIQSHAFHRYDEDWVRLTADSGRIYAMSIQGLVADLALYNDDSLLVASAASPTSTAYGNRLEWLCRKRGDYFLRVFRPSRTDIVHYAIAIDTLMPMASDVAEPDNRLSQAKPIAIDGSVATRTLLFEDADWSSFHADSGTWYRFRATGTRRIALRIWGLDSIALTQPATGNADTAATIGWQCRATGTYAISVTAPSIPLVGFSYTVSASTDASYLPDAFEPDDSIALGPTIATDGIAHAHSLWNSDIDWACFEALPAAEYVIATGGDLEPRLELHRITGPGTSTYVASGSSSREGRNSRIVWKATMAGRHCVGVSLSTPMANNGGPYTLSVLRRIP